MKRQFGGSVALALLLLARAGEAQIAGSWSGALRMGGIELQVVIHFEETDSIEPDRVHVLMDGRIVESGDKTLALRLERSGYGSVSADAHGVAVPL